MKKLFVIMIIICGVCLCSFGCEKHEGTPPLQNDGAQPSQNDASPPAYIYPFDYDSITEFQRAVQNKDELCSKLSNDGASGEMVEEFGKFIEKLQTKSIAVPCINGVMMELRNEEGFSNISLYASEAYGLPWIFYHPKVSTGENFYIKVTYVPDHVLETNKNPTASDVIRELSPNSPNLNNLGPHHKKIYSEVVYVHYCLVIAMIIEYENDNRNSTFFVYGDLLVEVKGSPEVWSEEWFSTLSFDVLNE